MHVNKASRPRHAEAVVFVASLDFPDISTPPPVSSPSPRAESEVRKLETLLQSEVSVVTTDEAVGGANSKAALGLRRRKRGCSRRQGEKEREREGGGMGAGDRGGGEERDGREVGESEKDAGG